MLGRIWSESSVFEKIRVILMLVSLSVLISTIFIRFLRRSYVSEAQMKKVCAETNTMYSGKFIIIDGEVAPICER